MATHKSLVIRNLMEDAALRIVDEICDEEEARDEPRYATSPECRMDAACFILNRIPQRYVSSARGQAHADQLMANDQQLFVDMVTLAHEGLRRVSSVRRSFYDREPMAGPDTSGPHFYLPTVKGRILNGTTFELVCDVDALLLHDDRPVEMFDGRWDNPYRIVDNAAGTYLFWPAPVAAKESGEQRTFEYEIRVEAPGFEPLRHFFALSRESTSQAPDALDLTGEHRLPDLYLLPAE